MNKILKILGLKKDKKTLKDVREELRDLLLVQVIDENSSILIERLGISEERYNELVGIIRRKYIEEDDIIDVIKEMHPHISNANELVFVSIYTYNLLREMKEKAKSAEAIKKLIDKLSNSNPTDEN